MHIYYVHIIYIVTPFSVLLYELFNMHNIILLLSMDSEPSAPRHPSIIGDDTDGIELNWIPLDPLEPNGDDYYLIQY